MKFLFLSFFILHSVGCAFAQVWVGDLDINQEKSVQIIEVMIAERLSGKSVHVFVDYGQKTNFKVRNLETDEKALQIVDPETKKEKLFASTAALLNFMESHGWTHYDTATNRNDGRSDFLYYFRRKGLSAP